MREVDLSGARLDGAVIRDVDLSGASLHGCSMRDSDLRGSDLPDLDPTTVELRGAIVTVEQAVALAITLGLNVRPEPDP